MSRRGVGIGGAALSVAVLAPFVVFAAPAGPVPGVNLVPFSAVYDLRLGRTDPGGSVVDMNGRYAVEFGDACEAFTTSQRLVSRLTNADGDSSVSDYQTTTVEQRDGLRYRFTVRQEADNQPAVELVGNARLKGKGKGGNVNISRPAEEELELPAGAVFPTEHAARLIATGISGKTNLTVPLYDASTDDGLYDVSAFVGKTQPIEKAANGLRAKLKGLRSWPVRLAYFPWGAKSEKPIYEVGFRLYENGVSDDIVIDYGDFAVKAEMTTLDLPPAPKC